MADPTEQSTGKKEKRTLDQSAIDQAIAAMRTSDPEAREVAADKAAPVGGGERKAQTAVSQAPFHANGGETFGDVRSDGQEDLDAAIAAIQSDVVEGAAASGKGAENGESAAAGETISEGAGQDGADAAIAAMPADSGQAIETAAAGQPAAGTAGVQDRAETPNSDSAGDGGPEASGAHSAAGGGTAPEGGAIAPEAPSLAAGDHPDGSDGHAGPSEAPDDSGGFTGSENRQGGPETGSVYQTERAAESLQDRAGLGADDSAKAENTFSDLEESDLADAGPGRAAAEAEQLAAMTASFGDEKEYVDSDGGDPQPAAEIAAAAPAKASPSASENGAGVSDRETVARDADVTERPAQKASAGASRKTGRQHKYRGLALVAAILLIGVAALYGPDYYSAYREKRQAPASPPAATEKAPHLPPAATPAAESRPHDPYQEKLREVERLRADLLAKKKEIDELEQFYRDGISELEEELQQEAVRHRIKTFEGALANHKIELDLRSIQRRWAYIDGLQKPANWLYQGSEELLFMSRQARIDLKMSRIASGIELTRHARHLNAGLQKYRLSPERLSIDLAGSRLRPLENIWNDLGEQNKTIARHVVANGDQAIIAEICEGRTARAAELKTLTIKAAKCLSQAETSELFLNQLSHVSPVAAKYLSNWNGQWLCLNGFRQLSPEVARHLFRWGGNWISLNGLASFPPEIGEMLLSWQGRQLELMGLVHEPGKKALIGYQQLADWEKSGGKLFVPEPIRSEIEKLNQAA